MKGTLLRAVFQVHPKVGQLKRIWETLDGCFLFGFGLTLFLHM